MASYEGRASDTMSSPLSKRPISYSESHMHIPNIQSQLAPLLVEDTRITVSTQTQTPIYYIVYTWSLRFSMHLALISLFETIFFWHFISVSEDTALISLVQGYTQGVLTNCNHLTQNQSSLVRDIFDLFINQTLVDAAGAAAATTRSKFNAILIRTSWLYFGGLLTLFSVIAALGIFKRYKTDCPAIIGENLTLVTFLGLYEWMFFSTIVLRYQAISMQELDSMVVDEFQQQC